ncbi:hypothetical protein [Chelativorans alearense]|nr:hypothetical protein [Chelativorans alearense]
MERITQGFVIVAITSAVLPSTSEPTAFVDADWFDVEARPAIS